MKTPDKYTCPMHPEVVLDGPGECPICGSLLNAYILGYDFTEFTPGMKVLDIGCGNGRQLQKLVGRGCYAVGVEVDAEKVRKCRELGLDVSQGEAERLPFPNASFDGVICKGVIPFTVEPLAFQEITRILKPGGTAQFCYLGAGYYLQVLLLGAWHASRIYGLRTIINTWLFVLTHLVMPGFLGDTLYQSRKRLKKYYALNRLTLLHDTPAKEFFGFPVIIYHLVQAAPAGVSSNLS